jgi:NHL repeat-containing protein
VRRRWIVLAGVVLAAAALTGCEGGTSMIAAHNPVVASAASAHGRVMGGQQPVTGASIYLYAAGAGGYGSAAASLLTGSTGNQDASGNWYVTTDANGNFAITGDWSCPASPSPSYLYVLSLGGNPGGSSLNPNLAEMAALGPCSAVNASTYVVVNEITTVASIWALSPFMRGMTNVGSSATNQAGLAETFAAVNSVANIATGTASGPSLPTGATLPIAKINTLANILASCVNSSGGTAGDPSPCGNLFSATTVNSVAPTNTVAAALNIAQQPAANVASLYALQTASPPFLPSLATAPNDLTIAINYTGGGLNAPAAIATDQSGNVWVANSGSDTVSWFDNLGNSKLGTTGTSLGGVPAGIAIDLSGNAWVTASNNDVYELSSSSGSIVGSPLTGFNEPTGIAIDPNNEIWVVNAGNNTVSAVNSSGVPLAGSPFSGAGISAPAAIAINGNANAN